MNRRTAAVMIVCLGITMTGLAQRRPYDQLMKDVGATFASLKKNLDSGALPAAAEDAAKLESLFKDSEAFWTPFKTKDALDGSRGAQAASRSVGSAARDGNAQKALAEYAGIGKYCKGCHDSHRELMPDKSYRIKP